MLSLKEYLRTLNLFRSSNNAEEHEDEYQQRTNVIITRIYIMLLFFILLGVTLGMSLIPYTTIIIIENPSRTQFESLPGSICSCSRISPSFNDFVSVKSTFHQVCSSDFVSDQWISSIYFGVDSQQEFVPADFRSTAFAQFRALASFCRLSQANVNQTLSSFGSTSFISSRVLSESDFQLQVDAIINRFKLTIANTFKTQMELVSRVIMGNQLMSGLGTSNTLAFHFDGYKRNIKAYFCTYSLFKDKVDFLCECMVSPVCKGVSGFYNDANMEPPVLPPEMLIMAIPGLIAGCMPVDAILSSSLECFYNQDCVDAIVPYLRIPTNFIAMDILVASHFPINSTIEAIVDELMVEDWNFNVSYNRYYNHCAPTSCTYSKTEQRRFLYVLFTLIGLLGGLCTGLGIILPPVVRFIRLIRSRANSVPTLRISMIDRLRGLKTKLKGALIELNLFKMYPTDDRQVFQQRIITRIYIVLILFAFIILTLYLSIRLEIQQETVYNLNESEFIHLQSFYSTSLQCPCTSISMPYNDFLTIEHDDHQLCSSDLISNASLAVFLLFLPNNDEYLGFSNTVNSHLHTIVTLCQLAKKTITNDLQRFLQEKFVTSQAISKEIFESQVNQSIEDWRKGIINNFLRTFKLIRAIQHGNHLGTAYTNFKVDSSDSGELLFDSIDLYGKNCTCLLSTACRSLVGIYNLQGKKYTLLFTIPGFFTGCSKVEALLASTLECFYSEDCTKSMSSALEVRYNRILKFTLLNASRNQANETIDRLVNRLFVDKWSSNISFSTYYQTCLPRICTFTKTSRRNFFSILTTIISVLGGLTTGLEILFSIFLRIVVKIRRGQSFRAHFYSVKNWFRNLFRQERLLDRLRNVLLVITLSVIFLFSSLTLQNQVKEHLKPSLEDYHELFGQSPTILQCPCSRVSIGYKSFMNFTVKNQHQICSSDFVSDRWFATLVAPKHLSAYSPFDFRNAAIGHFQLLAFLCQLTQQHLNDSLSDFAMKNFISSQLVSSASFDEQIQYIIKEFQMTTFNSFLITLQLIRDMISDNALIPVFQTNWKWISPINLFPIHYLNVIRTEPITYDNCTCDLSSQCVKPGTVSNKLILGLMVGCYPLESLLKSTLECLYDTTCFSQLQTMNESFTPLNISLSSRYPINSTVESILNELMIEEWSKNISYKKYYTECAPSYCSYTYRGHSPQIEVVMDFLGLYGGLTIIIQFVVFILVTLCQYVIKRRNNRIQPETVPQ